MPRIPRLYLGREQQLKIIKQFKKLPCLWDPRHMQYYNKTARTNALLALLRIWRNYNPAITLDLVKKKLEHLRSAYRAQRRKVESSVGDGEEYNPTLWYYDHLKFLSGENVEETDEQSESEAEDDNNENILEIPPKQKNTATDVVREPHNDTSASIIEASAAAFGQSVGAQIQHLSKVQRCIAEKLISDIIYHGKMENLTMNSAVNLNVELNTLHDRSIIDHDTIVIPKSELSWYEKVHSDGSQEESSSSCTFITNTDMRNQDQETQNAVDGIKLEYDESHNSHGTFHNMEIDRNEENNGTNIIKVDLD